MAEGSVSRAYIWVGSASWPRGQKQHSSGNRPQLPTGRRHTLAHTQDTHRTHTGHTVAHTQDTHRTHTGHTTEQIGPAGDSLQDTARTEGFDGRPLVCREQERGPYGLIPTNRTQQACWPGDYKSNITKLNDS